MKRLLMISMMILVVGLLSACTSSIQTIGADTYYVLIQDEGDSYEEQGNVRYEYKLEGYDENGDSLLLSFTANHSLKKNAYLKIFYKKDEVVTYEEVEKTDIPEKALEQLEVGEE